MKVLLINPAQDPDLTAGYYKRMLAIMPPISLAYLAAALEQAGVEVEVYDDAVAGGDLAALDEALRLSRADVVGLSVVTGVAPDVERVVARVRAKSPQSTVVLGNIHADVFHEALLRAGTADVVVHGEGERTVVELVQTLAEHQPDLARVRGISFLREGELVLTEPRPHIQDLDELPFPAWHLFPLEGYRIFNFARVRPPGTLIQGSRGCPYGCTYCSLKIMGSRRRVRSAASLADEFEYLYDRFGYLQPSFVDPIFPFSKKEGLAFAEELLRRKIPRRQVWITETRTDLVDDELLEALAEAGLRRIMYGFETGAQQQLNTIHKSNKPDSALRAVQAARRAGVEIIGFFMLGIPGSTVADLQATIDYACSLEIDFAKFTVFVPFPGTAVYHELIARDAIAEPENWRRYTSFPSSRVAPNYVPSALTAEDLVRYQRRAHLAFYLRPKMIAHQLFKVRTLDLSDLIAGAQTIVATGLQRYSLLRESRP